MRTAPAPLGAPTPTAVAPGRARVLVVSYRFAPYQSIGAISVGKTAKYLLRLGHDVRVLTATNQTLAATLPFDIDPEMVDATPWIDPLRPVQLALGGRARVAQQGFVSSLHRQGIAARCSAAYRASMVPDIEVGWLPYALRRGRRLVEHWRPDVIYSSGPPHTALVVAHRLARHAGVPWVAGLRDLWSDNPYREPHGLARRVDAALERRVLGSAAGIVVTNDEAARYLCTRYTTPVRAVMNGYDADEVRERTARSKAKPDAPLRVVYVGSFIRDKRDPSPLFDAMRLLEREGRTVYVDIYGRDLGFVRAAIEAHGVAHLVSVHGLVPYSESLVLQRDADVLLLLQWQNERERAICPGKLFEYAASRRPVLAIAPAGGVVERLVGEHHLGNVVQDVDGIVACLRRWSDEKRRTGEVADIALEPPPELSRAAQVAVLSDFLESTVATTGDY